MLPLPTANIEIKLTKLSSGFGILNERQWSTKRHDSFKPVGVRTTIDEQQRGVRPSEFVRNGDAQIMPPDRIRRDRFYSPKDETFNHRPSRRTNRRAISAR